MNELHSFTKSIKRNELYLKVCFVNLFSCIGNGLEGKFQPKEKLVSITFAKM